MPDYATVDELREAGLPSDLTDAQLEAIARRTTAQIEAWTRRWFYPRQMTLRIDGSGDKLLQIGPPIIAITEARILSPGTLVHADNELIDSTALRVYNRHLTEGLNDPDDRNNPKIQYTSTWEGGRRSPNIWPVGWFPRGEQNIQITGLFGYTEFDDGATLWTDGLTPVGRTPEMIKLACIMLAARDALPLGDVSSRVENALSGYMTKERTRDQEIGYSTPSKNYILTNAAGISQNKDIQALLAPYCSAQGALGAV